jgi:hypothetical protein
MTYEVSGVGPLRESAACGFTGLGPFLPRPRRRHLPGGARVAREGTLPITQTMQEVLAAPL